MTSELAAAAAEIEMREKPSVTDERLQEAVEALESCFQYGEEDAFAIVEKPAEKGFTIVRPPAMTDAELEREAKEVAISISALGFDRFALIIELVKKYRR